MHYLEALEGLRSQRFPQEPTTTQRYEIAAFFGGSTRVCATTRPHHCICIRIFLSRSAYGGSLRFTTRQHQRNCPKGTQQPYDPRLAMRCRSQPFVPLQPSKIVLPQGVLSPLTPPSNAPAAPVAVAPARAQKGACFNFGQNGHFARECPNWDQARKPGGAQPHLDEAVKATVEEYAECVPEKCSGVQFCVNCGMVDHVASQCLENPVSDNLAHNRWAETEAAGIAAQTTPASEDDRVLVLRQIDLPTMSPPLTVTCGNKQVQTSLELTTSTQRAERSYLFTWCWQPNGNNVLI